MLFNQPLRNNSFVEQYRVGQRLSEGTNALIDKIRIHFANIKITICVEIFSIHRNEPARGTVG